MNLEVSVIKICILVTSVLMLLGCSVSSKVERLSHGGAEDLYELANMYSSGRIVNIDEQMSMYYLSLASERGSVGAMYTLAVRYDKNGDLKKATKWYKKAAEPRHFNGHAMLRLARIYQSGELGGVNLDLAVESYINAAKLGYVEAIPEVARIYESKGHDKKAFIWYRIAERGGLSEAKYKAEVIGFKIKPMEVLDLEYKAHLFVKRYLSSYLN
ncbi:sel1 repeat family protein [Vibrio vulnificus]|nr:sel1 repeat family protein [Vibrio vulnificus]